MLTSSSHAIRRVLPAAFAAVLAVAVATPAGAHGDIRTATPEDGSTLKRPPKQIVLELAEAPASGSQLTVTDGCGETVSQEPAIEGATYSVPIVAGRPGRWRVRLRSISSVDGHLVKQNLSFRVAGKKDCTREEGATEGRGDQTPDTSSRPPIDNPEDGSSFPMLPFAAGTLALVVLALVVRRPWNKS